MAATKENKKMSDKEFLKSISDFPVEIINGDEFKLNVKEEITSEQLVNLLKIVYDYPRCVQAPLSKDSEIGKIEIFLGKNLLFSEKIYTIEDVKTKSILQRMQDFFKNW